MLDYVIKRVFFTLIIIDLIFKNFAQFSVLEDASMHSREQDPEIFQNSYIAATGKRSSNMQKKRIYEIFEAIDNFKQCIQIHFVAFIHLLDVELPIER